MISKNESILVVSSLTYYETQPKIPVEYQDAEVIFSVGESNRERLIPYGAIVLRKHS